MKKLILPWVLISLVLDFSISGTGYAETPKELKKPILSSADKIQSKQNSTSLELASQDQRGTEKMPFIIKSIPAEKTSEQAEEDRKERDIKSALDHNLTRYTGWQAFFAFIMVVVGSLQLGLFIWQLRLIRESLADTTRSADAARDSADISKLSMVASNRAYVHFRRCTWISHPDINDGHLFWRIRVELINSGNTPTRNLAIYVHWELRDGELPDDYTFARGNGTQAVHGTIYPQGIIQTGSNLFDIKGTDLLAISQGRKHLYIWGYATYRDVFPETQQHITKFCVEAMNITGNPLLPWNAADNPVDIPFHSYSRHNCADEDCEQGGFRGEAEGIVRSEG